MPLNLKIIQCVVITGDFASNRDQILHLYAGRTRFTNFCKQLEADTNVISGRFVGLTVPDKPEKLRYHHLKIFWRNSVQSCQKRNFLVSLRKLLTGSSASDVVSGVALE